MQIHQLHSLSSNTSSFILTQTKMLKPIGITGPHSYAYVSCIESIRAKANSDYRNGAQP